MVTYQAQSRSHHMKNVYGPICRKVSDSVSQSLSLSLGHFLFVSVPFKKFFFLNYTSYRRIYSQYNVFHQIKLQLLLTVSLEVMAVTGFESHLSIYLLSIIYLSIIYLSSYLSIYCLLSIYVSVFVSICYLSIIIYFT